jgi:hypothetical protein
VIIYGKETTGFLATCFIFITDAGDFFPNKNFFLDISSLYNNMVDNNGTPIANTCSLFAPYVSLFLFIELLHQFLVLAIGLNMLDLFC